MNTLCSYLLNRGFQQLGIDIDREKLRIKRELPRRESMRRLVHNVWIQNQNHDFFFFRSHRLSRLNDAYAGLDTRFSIMTMTYRKFIDMKASCFIPGKVRYQKLVFENCLFFAGVVFFLLECLKEHKTRVRKEAKLRKIMIEVVRANTHFHLSIQVLDEFFRIIDILKKSHDRGGTLTIDIHELLKDLRDLSRYN